MDHAAELEYVGFWPRVWATAIDAILVLAIVVPLVIKIYGWNYFISVTHAASLRDFVISWISPAIVVFVFWAASNATLGKMAISAIIVDERTGNPPSLEQYIGRYLGYFLAVIPFGLGLIWIAFDNKKQGWHDKLAGTIVIRAKKHSQSIHSTH